MPRTPFLVLPLLFVAACAPETVGNNNSVDINAAAVQAQGAVDAYSANADADMIEVPEPEAPIANANGAENALAPPAPGTPGGLPDDGTPMSETPFTADSAQGAANVVQTYYALIGEGKYREAFALREPGSETLLAFAAKLSRYRVYRAQIGAPSAIDAGAGQRYVTVPVALTTLRKGLSSKLTERWIVTLRRTAEVDGATSEQRSWRIQSINLKPGDK